MNADPMLPVCSAHKLPSVSHQTEWLIETLWAHQAVGILAGHPKLGKSWLGLDMALSVASKTPCLGRFLPRTQGPVLVYLAEDALPQLRQRLEQITRHRALALEKLPLFVITAPRLRLDLDEDRHRLQRTLDQFRPLLLLLDPLVRLHAVDENDAMAIAGLLGFLRGLQRTYGLGILLVHHARKNGGAAGLAMRGSSDLWAWGDSNLYLKRAHGQLLLTIEHRAAAAPDPVALRLANENPQTIHLETCTPAAPPSAPIELEERIHQALANGPLTRTKLRTALGVKNERLGAALTNLAQAKRIAHTRKGWKRFAIEKNTNTTSRSQRSLFPT